MTEKKGFIMKKNRKKSPAAKITAYVLAMLLFIGIVYYVTLPPISIYSGAFWTFFFFIDVIVFVSYYVIGIMSGKIYSEEVRMPSGVLDIKASFEGKKRRFPKVQFMVTGAVIVALIIAGLVGSQLFRAKTYSSLIDVEEADFATDIVESEYITDIALMDTASARIIGARTLGTLSDLVSQYNVSSSYTQIALRENVDSAAKPYKVAPLEYASFFKWLTNKNDGIPGYVRVDTVRFEAEFVRLKDGYINYSPSAYFSKNLERTLRFKYPTEIFGSICFEVDDSGNPFWVVSTMKPNAGLFGAMDVDTVITLNAVTGESHQYKPEESPDWIDIVYYGSLVCQKYDWYGMLREGYLNSAFSQTNCVVTTDDFGYKIIGNDVYIFTGVTSTSNDEANVGFILANSRTGEYKYFSVPGAEEYSAMSAAEGSVQQYRYTASFPSLVNVGGEATYIMVLKDASGIVKMYSMVNVRNYNIVVTSTTQDEVFQRYKAALAASGTQLKPSETKSEDVVVNDIIFINQNGGTTVYIKTSGGVFSMAFEESVLFIELGDTVSVYYSVKHESGVTPINNIEK